MKPKLIVDTNCVDSHEPLGSLFGNRNELEKISNITELIVPQIVIDEILHHKKLGYNSEKEKLKNNKLCDRCLVNKNEVDGLSFDNEVDGILSAENITYKKIDIKDKLACFEKIRWLAIENRAPFEPKNDKGFKDAIIAHTVDEYLSDQPSNTKVLLLTKDGRLAEYFQGNDNVIIVRNFDEVMEQIVFDPPMTLSSNNHKEDKNAFEITTTIKEPTEKQIEIRNLLTNFRNSNSYTKTHLLIAELMKQEKYLKDEDYLDILTSSLNNSQIYWILKDNDVNSFLVPIFNKYKDKLSNNQYNDFIDKAGLVYYKSKAVDYSDPDEFFADLDFPF